MSATTAKTPESLTAAQRATQLGVAGAQQPAGAAQSPKVSVAEARARLALAVERPANAAADLKVGDEYDGSMAMLPVMSIRPYEHNPRVSENPKYSEIKESIRTQGVTNQISVTKRPGEQHYIVAAGGNTRLQIVQELWQETQDPRWANLTVKYRAWRGEAAVIAAHLAENETRGDTTYWEKANGLSRLKAELERDQGRTLTSQDLHKEAKRLGMDFGLTMVQNLIFAVEHLSPLGPWLSGRTVQSSLQPTIVCLYALSDILDPTKRHAMRAGLQGCLTAQADALRMLASEPIAGHPVPTLDAQQVVEALNLVAAGILEVSEARLPLMVAARAANPRVTAAELRRLAEQPAAKAAPVAAPSSPAQLPLRPTMLSPVVAAAAADGPSAAPASNQQPAAASDGPAAGALPHPAAAPAPVSAPAAAGGIEHILDLLLRELAEVGERCELDDVLSSCPTLPLGYFVELPDTGIETINGEPAADVRMRKAAWHLLAALSGQWVPEVARLIPAEQSRWRSLMDSGELHREASLLAMAEIGQGGRSLVWSEDVARVLLHPEVGPAMARALALAVEVRRAYPQRFPSTMATVA